MATLILLALAFGVTTSILSRRVAAEIDRMRARGEYTSYRHLGASNVPDSENGAVIYEKAFKLLPKEQSFGYACKEIAISESHAYDPERWGRAESEVTQCAGVLALVREAQKKPECRFEAKWDDNALAPMWPYLYKLTTVSSLLHADALIKARKGDRSGALDSLDLMFGTVDALESEPYLLHWIRRTDILRRASDALVYAAASGEIAEQDARRLSDRLGKIDLLPGLLDAMKGEKAWMIWVFEEIRSTLTRDMTCLCADGSSMRAKLYSSPLGIPWSYMDEMNLLQATDERLKLAAKPYREVGPKRWNALDERKYGGMHKIYSLMPSYGRFRAEADTRQAAINAGRILLALNVYRGRFGAYPNSLKALESALRWNLNLEDPFSGKDLIYKRQGSGFVLYSVGQDLEDDGGIPVPKTEPGQMPADPRAYDIVWEMNR